MSSLRSLLGLTLISNRYPALHGMRSLAIVSVLQVHVSVILAQRGLLHDRDIYGTSVLVWFGMDLFFIMSGFLIGTLLLQRRPTDTIGRFYTRRIFRTFPLYYVVLTTLVIFFRRPTSTPSSIALEYVYLTNYGVLDQVHMSWAWSLCVEEHFYFVAPLLIWLLLRFRSDRVRVAILTLIVASGFFVRLWVVRRANFHWNDLLLFTHLYVRTNTRYDTLVAGVAIALLQLRYEKQLEKLFSHFVPRWICYAIFFWGVSWMMQPVATRSPNWSILAWGTVTSIMYVALMLPLLNHPGIAVRILGAKPFWWGATLGYGTYLIHIPVCEHLVAPIAKQLTRMQWNETAVWWSSFALLTFFSVGGSYLLHILVDKPVLALRQRYAP